MGLKTKELNRIKEHDNPHSIPVQERISFYLNNIDEIEVKILHRLVNITEQSFTSCELNLVSYNQYKNTIIHLYCKYIIQLPFVRNIRILPNFKEYKNLHSLMNFFLPFDDANLELKDFKFLFHYGEHGHNTKSMPVIRKSRRNNDSLSIIFNFRTLRLTLPCYKVLKKDIKWSKKEDTVIWRGATTGKEQRVKFVEKYFQTFDVGFATTKQKPEYQEFKRKKVSIKKQLKNKFIISLEGNDVASNLRWVLSSNSVPIMPKPEWQSWIMEEKLMPYVHYLPLNKELDNLEELISWAKLNDEKCQEIAENGKLYMAQFLDKKKDLIVHKTLLEEYAKKVTIRLPNINICFTPRIGELNKLCDNISSILKYADLSTKERLHFYFITSHESKSEITKHLKNTFSGLRINVISSEPLISSLDNISSHARYFIPSFFSKLDRVLFLDINVYIRSNISEMYDTYIPSHKTLLTMKGKDGRISTNLFIFDLLSWRRDKVSEKIKKELLDNKIEETFCSIVNDNVFLLSKNLNIRSNKSSLYLSCLLYTSDAADD